MCEYRNSACRFVPARQKSSRAARLAQGFKIGTVVATLALAACASQPRHHQGMSGIGTSEGAVASADMPANAPDQAGALNLRGTTYGERGEYHRAIADFSAAIQLAPDYYQAYANRALVHARTGNANAALADYNQAIAIAADYQPAYVGRGRLYMTSRQLDLALADFDKAIDMAGDDAVSFYNRGLIYQAMNRHQEAVADFDRAIMLRPEANDPQIARAVSLQAGGQQISSPVAGPNTKRVGWQTSIAADRAHQG